MVHLLHGLQNATFDGDTLELDADLSLPVEIGSERAGHNIVFVRRVTKHLLWIFEDVIEKDIEQGIMVIGPPGSGKV